MSKIGTADIKGIMLGNTEISKAYLGSDIVYQKNVPLPYDAVVEYIQGTGTQWINPQYTTTSNSIIVVDCQLSAIAAQKRIVGNITTGYFEIYINGSSRWSFASNGSTYASSVSANTSRHTFKIDNVAAKGYIDNTAVNIGRNAAKYYGTAEIFTRHTASDNRNCSGKIYSATIYEGTTPIRDFIPVRKDGIGYLYDKVSGYLFGNAGTGDFTYGNDIN